MPIGYHETVNAYRIAGNSVTVDDLSNHYTQGLDFFYKEFVPYVKSLLFNLSGGVWNLDDYEAFASGSDVDFMQHIINAIMNKKKIVLYPGDWFGFLAGFPQQERIEWNYESKGHLACLCIPSVRNGHITQDMLRFLEEADQCLLNLNLYPTLTSEERQNIATELKPMLDKSVLSISFSRGFALTASQLGMVFIKKNHPLLKEMRKQLEWFTYFYNLIAAKAFMKIRIEKTQIVDDQRRQWVKDWLTKNNLPVIDTGSYYVKSFKVEGDVSEYLKPLVRQEGFMRLCFKPTIN